MHDVSMLLYILALLHTLIYYILILPIKRIRENICTYYCTNYYYYSMKGDAVVLMQIVYGTQKVYILSHECQMQFKSFPITN